MTKAISEAVKVLEELQKQVVNAEKVIKTRIEEAYKAGTNAIVWDAEKVGGWVVKGITHVDNFFVHFIDGTKAHFSAIIHPDHLAEVSALNDPVPVIAPVTDLDPTPATVATSVVNPIPEENTERPETHVPDAPVAEVVTPEPVATTVLEEVVPVESVPTQAVEATSAVDSGVPGTDDPALIVPEVVEAAEVPAPEPVKATLAVIFFQDPATKLIELSSTPADATSVILFTTNGSDPATPANPATQLYGSPLALGPGSVIRALAADPAGNLLPSTTESFSVPAN